MVEHVKKPRGAHLNEQRLRQVFVATALLASLGGPLQASAQTTTAATPGTSQHTRQVSVDVRAQDLDQALTQFADQADLHLLFTSAEVAGLHSQALRGEMSVEQALQSLLKDSGLVWQFSDARTVILGKPQAPAQSLQLKALEVSVGARTSTSISEIPGTVWVVDQVQLQEQLDTGVTLKEAIGKLVPGLDLAPEGRSNYGQNMRGRNVLVMIDGVSQNSSRGLSRQFDSISPFNVERIEVLSGASALYGGGATGGIINIVTKKGTPGPAQFETELSATSGFNNSDDLSSRISQSVSGGTDRVYGRLGISGEQNEAFYDGKGDQVFIDNTQTDLQYNRTLDLMGAGASPERE